MVCNPGELIGLLGVITGEPNNSSIQAACKGTRLAVIARESFFLLIRSHPQVLVNAAHLMSIRLSPLLRQADFALEWLAVDAGKALYKYAQLYVNSSPLCLICSKKPRLFKTIILI